MRRAFLLAIALMAPMLAAQDGSDVLVIRATSLFDGHGNLGSRVLVVRDGRIEKIGGPDTPVPFGATVRELDAAWVTPGLVLAHAPSLVGLRDGPEAVTPTVRAADSFDPFLPVNRWLRNGVTVAYLPPGRLRLVSGQGAVVRLGAKDPFEAVLESRAALQACLAEEGWSPPSVYDAPVPPGPDNPLPPMRRQFPQSRGGAVLALRRCFGAAAAGGTKAEVLASLREELQLGRHTLSLSPFAAVLAKKIPLRVYAQRSADILAAVELARSLDIRLVIEGGREAWRVADELAEVGATVVLEGGDIPGGPLDPPEPFAVGQRGRAHPQAAAHLRKHGVKLSVVPPSGARLDDLVFYLARAGRALPAGGADTDLLRCLTGDAAEILGIEDRAGRLLEGRVADIVLYDRHPLLAGSRPRVVIADGRVVWEADAAEASVVAIHGEQVHLGDGHVLEDRWVVVSEGRIAGVTTEAGIPAGARLVRLDGVTTITPGFIDVGGQIGFRSYSDAGNETGVQLGGKLGRLKAGETPLTNFDPSFEDVLAAARSGVTTVALTPAGGQRFAGPLSVVKTAPTDTGKARVLKTIGGLLVDDSNARWSVDSVEGTRNFVKTAKAYHDSWIAYDKKFAEWKAKNSAPTEAKAPAKKLGKVKAPAVRDPISGTWRGTAMLQGQVVPLLATLKLSGTAITGGFETPMFPGSTFEIESELIGGRRFSFTLEVSGRSSTVDMTVGREEMHGSLTVSGVGSGSVNLHRTERPSGDGKKGEKKSKGSKDEAKAAASTAKGAPKKPKLNPSLEPWRDLFRGDATLFYGVGSERLARATLPIFAKEFGLRVCLITPNTLPATAGLCRELGISVALPGASQRRVRGELVNPLRSAVWSGCPTALRTGWGADVRNLVPLAHHAVYQGISPADGVAMLSSRAARILGLDKRIGTLRRGHDADLVIFEGSPFEGGSRIRKVMVDGRFVGEEVNR